LLTNFNCPNLLRGTPSRSSMISTQSPSQRKYCALQNYKAQHVAMVTGLWSVLSAEGHDGLWN
jgi:hypothetical protein